MGVRLTIQDRGRYTEQVRNFGDGAVAVWKPQTVQVRRGDQVIATFARDLVLNSVYLLDRSHDDAVEASRKAYVDGIADWKVKHAAEKVRILTLKVGELEDSLDWMRPLLIGAVIAIFGLAAEMVMFL